MGQSCPWIDFSFLCSRSLPCPTSAELEMQTATFWRKEKYFFGRVYSIKFRQSIRSSTRRNLQGDSPALFAGTKRGIIWTVLLIFIAKLFRFVSFRFNDGLFIWREVQCNVGEVSELKSDILLGKRQRPRLVPTNKYLALTKFYCLTSLMAGSQHHVVKFIVHSKSKIRENWCLF